MTGLMLLAWLLPPFTLLLLLLLGGVILIFVVLTLYSALFGIAIWFVIVGALRMMAKSEAVARTSSPSSRKTTCRV